MNRFLVFLVGVTLFEGLELPLQKKANSAIIIQGRVGLPMLVEGLTYVADDTFDQAVSQSCMRFFENLASRIATAKVPSSLICAYLGKTLRKGSARPIHWQ
jgi:hypothetical protein